jgi:hypothetical protein
MTDFEQALEDVFSSIIGIPVFRRALHDVRLGRDLVGVAVDVILNPHEPDPKRKLAKRWRSGKPFEELDVDRNIIISTHADSGFYSVNHSTYYCWFVQDGRNLARFVTDELNAMRRRE